jgi:hypothetical protein
MSPVTIALCLALQVSPDVTLTGPVPDGADDFFDLSFEVPAGTAEIEIHQRALDDADILDFSLEDPEGFRGEGGGRISVAILNADAATRSYLPGPITPGTWEVSVGKAKLVSDAPAYEILVFFRGETTLPPATDRGPYAPIAAIADGARYYAGDFHVHSEDSNDAQPALDDIASFARGRGLDFVVITDHNTTAHIDRLASAQTRALEDGAPFLFVPGVEFTTYAGHATGFGATELVDWRVSHEDITLQDALEEFAAQGALFSINHPALDLGDLCIGCAWEHGPPTQGLAHGVEIETGGYRQAGFLFLEEALLFWEALLDEGHHLAALGGSDDHEGGQGDASPIGDPTTLVWAEGLSVEALKRGILDSRTVVKLQGPDDPMIELHTSPERNGDTVAHHDTVTVSATVTGAVGLELWFVQDGLYEASHDVTTDPQTFHYEVAPPTSGETRVRAQLDEVSGAGTITPRTLTSYAWIKSAPAPPLDEGCGCTSTERAPRGLAWLGLLWLAIRAGGAMRARRSR